MRAGGKKKKDRGGWRCRGEPSLGIFSRWVFIFTEKLKEGAQGVAFSSVLVSNNMTCSFFGDPLSFQWVEAETPLLN